MAKGITAGKLCYSLTEGNVRFGQGTPSYCIEGERVMTSKMHATIQIAVKSIIALGSLLALIFLYSLKAYYGELGNWVLAHIFIILLFFALNIYCFRTLPLHICWLIIAASTIALGFMPYRLELSRISGVIFDPSADLSSISRGLPRLVGLTVDSLFFVFFTLVAFLIAAFVTVPMNKRRG